MYYDFLDSRLSMSFHIHMYTYSDCNKDKFGWRTLLLDFYLMHFAFLNKENL